MKGKTFKIRVKIAFPGYVSIVARTRQEAEEKATKAISATFGTLELHCNREEMPDYDISMKSETLVNRKEAEDGK